LKISPDTRVYIAGCGGMLGEAVYARFTATGATVLASDIDVNEPWLVYGDVRDYWTMEKAIRAFEPDLIINLAAITDMEYCERAPEKSWLTNALGAENLGLIANKLDVPYVYISSAGIFGGEMDIYNDFDAPNPLAIYAKSKYYGERYVCTNVPNHFVLRAGWMMGGGPKKDKKFINKLYKQIQAGTKTLHVVDDKLGTPTYTVDFANGMLKILESELYGLYNQVCGGTSSRYEVAVEFIRLLGLENTISVNVVGSDFFANDYFAPRPASEQLVNLKLNQRGLNFMRDWKVCLAEYANSFR
jgi:dTDP-4-dehydrorhamnose reductase